MATLRIGLCDTTLVIHNVLWNAFQFYKKKKHYKKQATITSPYLFENKLQVLLNVCTQS